MEYHSQSHDLLQQSAAFNLQNTEGGSDEDAKSAGGKGHLDPLYISLQKSQCRSLIIQIVFQASLHTERLGDGLLGCRGSGAHG